VRLQEDAAGGSATGADARRLRGVVDEVATGLRATFRTDQELVTALLAAVGGDPQGPSWGEGDRAPRVPSAGDPYPIFGEE
jgi:hypothetical protein